MGIGDRLVDNSATNVRASRGASRWTQVMNALVVGVFVVMGVVAAARGAVPAALFCFGIGALAAVAFWFRALGTRRAARKP